MPSETRHTSRGVSLPPMMERPAIARANALGLGFSAYVQSLIELDLRSRILQPLPTAEEISR